MLGKIAAAMIGGRLAGRNKGAKGAVIGIAAETVLKKVIPALAAVAVAGFAYKKGKQALRKSPSYPSDASPSPPPST